MKDGSLAHDLGPPRWKSPFEKRKSSLQETVEASGITSQPCLLTTNQAQVGHLTNDFCFAWHVDQLAARLYRESQSCGVDTLLELGYQRIVQRPGPDGNFPPGLFLGGNIQLAFQGFARATTLHCIGKHAPRVIFFPRGQQGADKVFAIAEVVIERSAGGPTSGMAGERRNHWRMPFGALSGGMAGGVLITISGALPKLYDRRRYNKPATLGPHERDRP